jgi:RpiB/LacA/LacB family sugar-phosphate isomerase
MPKDTKERIRYCITNLILTIDGGILLCGSGIGISIAANKHKGIRAALCHDGYTATMCRKVLCDEYNSNTV